MINKQSAERSTLSRKQPKTICQLRTNTAALFSVDSGKTTKTTEAEAPQHNKARLPRCPTNSPWSILWEKNQYTMRYQDQCMALVSSVATVYTTYHTTFAWRSLTTGTVLPLVSHVQKSFPAFLVHTPPCYKSDNKRVCNRVHQCVLLIVSIFLARVRTMSTCPN